MRVIGRSGPSLGKGRSAIRLLVHQSIVPCALPGPDYKPRRPRPQLPIAPEDHWLLQFKAGISDLSNNTILFWLLLPQNTTVYHETKCIRIAFNSRIIPTDWFLKTK